MATYQELKAQAEALLAQAEQLRKEEVAQAIADIKAKMQTYGITPRDIGFSAPAAKAGHKKRKSSPAPRYRGPNGETWTGGRGRKPQWVSDALASGRKLEEFAVN